MPDVTRILEAVRSGEPQAADRLLAAVYEELRHMARSKIAREPTDHTLQATALVHEAWLRLSGGAEQDWDSRAHFFSAGAEAMRRILVERARRKSRLKHGGAHQRQELEEIDLVDMPADVDLLALDEALDRLEAEDARKAQLVKLRFFTGLSLVEAAEILGISRATADRDWAYARAWLYHEVGGEE